MSPKNLGLFDTPPDRKETRLALAIVVLLGGAFLVILPVRDIRLQRIDTFVPAIDAMMVVADLVTATLLYAQGAVFRSRALIALASGYLFAAALLVDHALTFPGAFAPGGLLGAGINTTAWLAIFQRAAFPSAIILYVLLKRAALASPSDPDRPAEMIGPWLLGAVVLAIACTALATVGHALLPPFYVNETDLIYSRAVGYQLGTFALLVIATWMLLRARKSVLDLWLLVALAGWLIQSLLIMTLHARFTAGFYCLFVLWLASHLVVMLALLADSNRLYAKLVLSSALRNEEKDARLMSMEAVAAAISHEVGQPVTAANMSASAALDWLSRSRPDVPKAITALEGAIDSGHRAFDVIKSIRSMFGRGGGGAIEFDLNDLATETATLLQHELAAKKIEIDFSLDRELPPVFADRVMMQRVLLNLYTNSIEAIELAKRKLRRIHIRSVLTSEGDALIEVSDTGVGIAPQDLPYIFDAFISTKSGGTGLGLSLCRTIAEEHGGKLWASQRERDRGATFHLQLPTCEAAGS